MTEIKATRDANRAPLGSLAYAYALLVAVLAAFGLHALFISGPVLRDAAHDDVVRAIADEDHHFCETFGMRFGTDAFAACSRELSVIRRNQTERDNAAAEGIL